MTFKVCEKKCDQCLFSKDRIVDEDRMREVLATCAKNDSHFICHKHSIVGASACCRAFYDRDPGATNFMRIAGRLGAVEFVPFPVDDNPVPLTSDRERKAKRKRS